MASGDRLAPIPIETRVDDLESRLKSKLETLTGFADEATMAHELNKVFRFFNADKDGFLSLREFEAALVRLNVVGMQKEVAELHRRYDVDGSGFVSYEELSACLLGLIPNPKGDPVIRSAVDKVRHKIAERGGLNGIRSLGRIFRSMDDSGNRKLDREELKVGLREYGVKLGDKEIDTVMSVFDRNGDGVVDFDELLRGLRGNLSPRRREVIMRAFDVLDKDGSGKVELSDVESAYDASLHPKVQSGEMTEEEVLIEFMDQWDTLEDDNVVTREEFLEYYKDVSASVDTDDEFCMIVAQAWHMTDEDGNIATSNTHVRVVHSDGSDEVVGIKDDLGLDRTSFADVKSRLEKQGVTDIVEISFAD